MGRISAKQLTSTSNLTTLVNGVATQLLSVPSSNGQVHGLKLDYTVEMSDASVGQCEVGTVHIPLVDLVGGVTAGTPLKSAAQAVPSGSLSTVWTVNTVDDGSIEILLNATSNLTTTTSAVRWALTPIFGAGVVNAAASIPTGSMSAFAGAVSAIPTGWLACDGSEYDETVETALFAVIGTAYNTGGETGGFFRVPDSRGRSLTGINDGTLPNGANGSFTTRALAAVVGAENHVHTIPSQAGHGHGLTITADGIHQHIVNVAAGLGTHRFQQANPGYDLFNTNGSHSHGGSSVAANAAHDHGGTNSGTTLSPRLHVNQIIKT